MTKKDMEQIWVLEKEIRSIKASMVFPEPTIVTISYKDYSRSAKGIPKSDSGYDYGGEDLRRLNRELRKAQCKLLRQLKQADEFIKAVPDAEMRTILREYYRNHKTQEYIADELGYERSTITQKLKRFWMNNQLSHISHF